MHGPFVDDTFDTTFVHEQSPPVTQTELVCIAGPAGPVAPVWPVAPVGPVGPIGPAGPVSPFLASIAQYVDVVAGVFPLLSPFRLNQLEPS